MTDRVADDAGGLLGDVTGTLNCMDMKLYVRARYGWDVLVTFI